MYFSCRFRMKSSASSSVRMYHQRRKGREYPGPRIVRGQYFVPTPYRFTIDVFAVSGFRPTIRATAIAVIHPLGVCLSAHRPAVPSVFRGIDGHPSRPIDAAMEARMAALCASLASFAAPERHAWSRHARVSYIFGRPVGFGFTVPPQTGQKRGSAATSTGAL